MLANTSKNGILTYRFIDGKIITMELVADLNQPWGDVRDHDPTPNEPVPEQKKEIHPVLKEIFRLQDEFDLKRVKNDIDGMRKVLEEMKAQLMLLKLDTSFPRIGEKPQETHSQAIFELEQDIDFYELVIEDMMNSYRKIYNRLYIEPLREHMNELYKKQKEHYEVQKQRFEACKQKYGRNHTDFFPKADQEFIFEHRAQNREYRMEYEMVYEQVEMLTQLMEQMLTPTDC